MGNELTVKPPNILADNPELRRKAREMYYAGIYVTEIVEHLNLDLEELTRYVFGADGQGTAKDCWAFIKLHRPRSSAVTYERVKPFILKGLEFKLLNRIRASADEMEKDNRTLDIDEMNKAMSVVERLDKITRLEEGKATAIQEVNKKTYSLRDITAQVLENEDDIEDAEYTEVDSPTSRPREGHSAALPSPEEDEPAATSSEGDGGSGSQGNTRPPSPQADS